MKIIVTAKTPRASKVFNDELVELKSMSFLDKQAFKRLFDVRVEKEGDSIKVIELVGKNRFPDYVEKGLLAQKIKESLSISGLTLKDFSVEEDRE